MATSKRCEICGQETDGTQGIIDIGEACDSCLERWQNGDALLVSSNSVEWKDEVTSNA